MSASWDASEPDFYTTGHVQNDSGYCGNSHAADPATSGYGAATSPPIKAPPVVPDAVLNMAAKGPQDKKPFAYVADVNDIREQRDRVRKRFVCQYSSISHAGRASSERAAAEFHSYQQECDHLGCI